MRLLRFFNTYEPVSSIIRDLAPALAEANLQMELVISAAEYRRGRRGLDDSICQVGGRIVRIPSGVANARSGIGKLTVISTYSIGAALYSLVARRATLNVFLTQPPLFFAWAPILRIFRRQPYVIILMDMYPDAAVAHGSVKQGGLTHRLGQWIAGVSLRSADRVFVIGRCMEERVLNYGVARRAVTCIPNWADEQRIVPVERRNNPLAAELGIGDELVVLYSGNMGVGHDFGDLLAVARRLKDNDRIRFVFIGDGVRRKEIERFRHDHRLGNIVIRDFVDADRMSESQSLGDVHFVSLREEFEGVMVPSKVYGALAAGRPIIYHGGAQSEVGKMVREEGIGAVVANGEVDRLQEALTGYAMDPARLQRQGQRARDLATGKYSRESAISAYVAHLRRTVELHQVD